MTCSPGVGCVKPGVGCGNPGVGCGNPGIGCVKPGVGCVKPGVRCVKPGVGCGNPGVACVNPGVGCVKPGVGCVKPGVGCVKPGVVCVKPGVGCVKPGVGCVKPGVGCGNPGVGCVKPGVGCGNPGVGCDAGAGAHVGAEAGTDAGLSAQVSARVTGMRLARLELNGIGPFEDATFEISEPEGPGELVLFEGPNGSGKTTIVEAMAVLLSGSWARGDVSVEDAAQRMDEIPWLCTMPPLQSVLRRRRGPRYAALASITHGGDSMDVVLAGHEKRLARKAMIHWSHDPYGTAVRAQLARFGTWVEHEKPIEWAAFAYRAHQPSAELATAGPRDIEVAPLAGALSFGAHRPESGLLGQLLANLENERTKALAYASEEADPQRRLELAPVAASRQAAIRRFETVFSKVLGRRTTIEFSIGRQAPTISFDGEPVPLDLLGEGLRSTMAWLSDLLVRLERVRWADIARSPIDQDFWLILDEIDESLHPTLQARILPALRELFPNARIYATTHSPFVVASAAQGTIFPIRPAPDHRVRGKVAPMTLEPGQSLEWVITEIFEAQVGIVDPKTRSLLDAHKRDLRRLERGGSIEWDAFLARRAELMELNDEVRTVVAMQEVPVRAEVDQRLRARTDAQRNQADA